MPANTQLTETILTEYCRLKGRSLESLEDAIIDLMTDLMHLARTRGLDPYRLIGMAQVHFESE